MDVKINDKSLVCVEYPAVVRNTDKMMQTLGGIETVSKVYNDPNRRLDLKFRPDEAYCKCVHGDRYNTTNLLLKIVRRKKKGQTGDEGSIVRVEIVGTVNTSYKFRSMADFQYLPAFRNSSNQFESLVSSLIPTGLPPLSWLQEDCPLFVIPPIFSRLDTPSNYHFRKDPAPRAPPTQDEISKKSSNVIGRGRAARSGIGIFVNHEEQTPQGPSEIAKKFFAEKGKDPVLNDNLSKAFVQRPIWSRTALTGIMQLDYNRLKFMLPKVAYYIMNGPWRGLWVRYGYSPRENPEALRYQLLDLRLNITPGPGIHFSYKRSMHSAKLTTKISNPQPRVGLIDAQSLGASSQFPKEPKKEDFSLRYIFREGQLPQYRQIFYQLCDIELESVQKLLSKEKGNAVCHDRDGWCSVNFLEKCRELMLNDVKKTAEKIKKEHQHIQTPNEEQIEEEDEDMELMSDMEDDPDYMENE